jgi:hypothetical protein
VSNTRNLNKNELNFNDFSNRLKHVLLNWKLNLKTLSERTETSKLRLRRSRKKSVTFKRKFED